MGVLEGLGSLLLALGCLLALTGSLGVVRMPDFYSRLHPAGKTDTLGQLLMLSGLMLFAGQQILTLLLADEAPEGAALLGWANILLKVALVSALLFVTAPTSTHAIAKAARLDRHTAISVDGDPARVAAGQGEPFRVQDIVVDGDVTRRLDEAVPAEALDVHEQEEPR
jgi:multicomponent Na+:H+ antiporter subunit G